MGISLRDERGQGVIEYVLVLVVAVSIILGGLYQLNSAFKTWANNYFGEYLACLLETGELPTISGNPGDSGICNELFKPFSLAEGRPLLTNNDSAPEKGGQGERSGERERRGGGGGGGYAGGSYGGPSFSAGGRFQGKGPRGRPIGKPGTTNTGNTAATGYGGGYSALNRRLDTGVRTRLDTRFAFDDGRERAKPIPVALAPPKPQDSAGGKKFAMRLRQHALKKDGDGGPSSTFTVADFLRWLIIAAIVIAVLVVLGGQGLQIGKSMDRGD